mgnify:CR=1 FL=1
MREILKMIIPKSLKKTLEPYRKQWRNFKILAFEYGQWRTIKNWECVDKDGKPIPWFTYPAIEYLNHLDLSDCSVFEYGLGFSTLFWLQRVKDLVSVENDRIWYKTISEKIEESARIKYLFFENPKGYVNSLLLQNKKFDIYVIDGRWRGECAKVVLNNITQYGGDMIIFDNSDWYPRSIEFLRNNLNWVEVGFHGFGPIADFTTTTTIFVNRSCIFKYKSYLKSVACMNQISEDDLIEDKLNDI